VLVQPSTYGTDNRCHLEALAAFGPSARMVAVVDDSVSTEELKRMHELGVRGIRFNLAQAGATTPEMMEPLSKRINDLGWHIQINAPAARIMEVMPLLERVTSPIVFDHLAHTPQPDGVNHALMRRRRRSGASGAAIGHTRRSSRSSFRTTPCCRTRRRGTASSWTTRRRCRQEAAVLAGQTLAWLGSIVRRSPSCDRD
jgi:hypothetical protein